MSISPVIARARLIIDASDSTGARSRRGAALAAARAPAHPPRHVPGPGSSVLALSAGGLDGPENPVVKFFISGSATWVFELCCGHFLEFLKISKVRRSA